jgi:phage-related protein
MSTTIGAVDFIVGLDGRTVPTQARILGERIGAALAAAAARRMNLELGRGIDTRNAGMELAGRSLGVRLASVLSDSFQKELTPAMNNTGRIFQRSLNVGNTLEDIGELRVVSDDAAESVRDLGRETSRTDSAWGRFRSTIAGVGDRLRNVRDNMRESNRDSQGLGETILRVGSRLRTLFSFDGGKFVSMLGSINDHWKDMTHGVRQAIFYVALFATLATQIAVLGSAAGVALTILAGALLSVALAGGAAVLLFQGLSGEISEMDPAIQPAVTALRSIGDAFGVLQSTVQASVLPTLIPAFEAIAGLVATLTPSIVILAGAVGTVITQFANMITSANGIEVMTGLIEGAATIFELLGSAVLNLGGALGNIFLIAQPYIETFATWLDTVFTTFNNWTQSAAGNQAISQWLENGMTVLSALGDLAVQVGDFLAQLVTPATIQSLLTFMDIIGQSLQPLGDFLLALDSFGIFNLIAQLITTVFTALQPLMPALSLLGQLFQGVLLVALQAITPLLTLLVEAFAALVEPLVGALMPILPMFAELIGQTALMFTPLMEAVVLLATTIGTALAPFLGQLVALFFTLISALMPLIEAIIPPLAEILTVLAQVIGETLQVTLPPLIDAFIQILDAVIPIIPEIVNLMTAVLDLIVPLLELIGPVLPPLMDLLGFLVSASVVPLTAALQFLTPVIAGVARGISDFLMPIIAGLRQALEGLGQFISGVFNGDIRSIGDGLMGFFSGLGSAIIGGLRGAVNGAISIINGLIRGINNLTGAVGIPGIPTIPQWAKGGIAWQSMLANIGEDGPEMVVPLRRPLSMIDPAVRDVAAYAQGKTTGNGGGGDTNITVEEGAIQIVGPDARKAAIEVVDRIIEVGS